MVFAAAVAVCCVAVYCVRASHSDFPVSGAAVAQSEGEEQKAPEQPPAVVAVDKAMGLTTLQARQYTGRVVAIEEVDIVPRVTGWLEKINVVEGEMVNKGDVLFEIEDTTYQVQVQTAEAKLNKLKRY